MESGDHGQGHQPLIGAMPWAATTRPDLGEDVGARRRRLSDHRWIAEGLGEERVFDTRWRSRPSSDSVSWRSAVSARAGEIRSTIHYPRSSRSHATWPSTTTGRASRFRSRSASPSAVTSARIEHHSKSEAYFAHTRLKVVTRPITRQTPMPPRARAFCRCSAGSVKRFDTAVQRAFGRMARCQRQEVVGGSTVIAVAVTDFNPAVGRVRLGTFGVGSTAPMLTAKGRRIVIGSGTPDRLWYLATC